MVSIETEFNKLINYEIEKTKKNFNEKLNTIDDNIRMDIGEHIKKIDQSTRLDLSQTIKNIQENLSSTIDENINNVNLSLKNTINKQIHKIKEDNEITTKTLIDKSTDEIETKFKDALDAYSIEENLRKNENEINDVTLKVQEKIFPLIKNYNLDIKNDVDESILDMKEDINKLKKKKDDLENHITREIYEYKVTVSKSFENHQRKIASILNDFHQSNSLKKENLNEFLVNYVKILKNDLLNDIDTKNLKYILQIKDDIDIKCEDIINEKFNIIVDKYDKIIKKKIEIVLEKLKTSQEIENQKIREILNEKIKDMEGILDDKIELKKNILKQNHMDEVYDNLNQKFENTIQRLDNDVINLK